MRNSALVLSWLRLVQAARNGEEQNTEAFLKAGQLYVRTIRDIRQEEELLVWYDQELCHLLGFTDMSRASGEGEAELCDAEARGLAAAASAWMCILLCFTPKYMFYMFFLIYAFICS